MNKGQFSAPLTPAQPGLAAEAPPVDPANQDSQKSILEVQSRPDDVPDALDSSSVESLPDVNRTLKEAKCYSTFLLKVGFEFLLYYLAFAAIIVFMMLDVRRTRTFYRMAFLDSLLWMFLGFAIVIKVTCAFLGPWMRVMLKPFYFLDLASSTMFVFGLYYYLQEWLDSYYVTYSPFVVVFVFCLLISMCMFVITTFYNSKSYRYNFYLGIILMTTGTTATALGLFFGWKAVVTITTAQYVWIMIIMGIHNIYFAVNAFLVVRYRHKSTLEHDSVIVFFRFWTDPFFFFWKDLVMRVAHKRVSAIVLNFGENDAKPKTQEEAAVEAEAKPKRIWRIKDPNEITSSIASDFRAHGADSDKQSVQIA